MKTVKIILLVALSTSPVYGYGQMCVTKFKRASETTFTIVEAAKKNLRLNTTKHIPAQTLNELFETLNTARDHIVTIKTLTAIFKALTTENYQEISKKLDATTNFFIETHPFEEDLKAVLIHNALEEKVPNGKASIEKIDDFQQIMNEFKKLNSTMEQVKKLLAKQTE